MFASPARTRAHLPNYISGQFSNILEKSVEPIAIHADIPPEIFLVSWGRQSMHITRYYVLVNRQHCST